MTSGTEHIRVASVHPPATLLRAGRGVPAEPPRRGRAAFSLIEVNIALLVVSVGLAALLVLFPVGLRESGLATADTTEAVFATRMLNAIQANAGEIDRWDTWTTTEPRIMQNPFTRDILGVVNHKLNQVETIHNAYGIQDNVIRYKLDIGFVGGTDRRLRYAAIRVADDAYSAITNNVVYYTEFRFGSH